MLLKIAIVLLLLSACTSQPTVTYPSQSPISSHKTLPSSWKIIAKLGIRAENGNGSLNVQWQQKGQDYVIRTSAALGQGKAVLEGNNTQLILKRPGKPTIYSNSPEQLLENTLGWSLPLEKLPYWIMGKKHPLSTTKQLLYSADGKLIELHQNQWQIRYSRHKPVSHWILPHKIVAINKDHRLTLLIKTWQFDVL